MVIWRKALAWLMAARIMTSQVLVVGDIVLDGSTEGFVKGLQLLFLGQGNRKFFKNKGKFITSFSYFLEKFSISLAKEK